LAKLLSIGTKLLIRIKHAPVLYSCVFLAAALVGYFGSYAYLVFHGQIAPMGGRKELYYVDAWYATEKSRCYFYVPAAWMHERLAARVPLIPFVNARGFQRPLPLTQVELEHRLRFNGIKMEPFSGVLFVNESGKETGFSILMRFDPADHARVEAQVKALALHPLAEPSPSLGGEVILGVWRWSAEGRLLPTDDAVEFPASRLTAWIHESTNIYQGWLIHPTEPILCRWQHNTDW
jgi:hypothetical protein